MQLPSILTPDFGLLFWMLLAFGIVFVLLWRYGFPVIIKMVEERKAFIDESLAKAREANEKLAHIQAESDAILRAARDKQAAILREAMATKEAILSEAREKAQAEGHKILEEAKAQINAERENALSSLRGEVAGISVKVAEQLLLSQLQGQSAQEAYVERLLQQVEQDQA